MAWTNPRTWVAGELVTAGIGNVHWRDNFRALRAQTQASVQLASVPMGGDWEAQQRNVSFTQIPGHAVVELDGDDVTGVEVHCMAKVDAGTGQIRMFNITDVGILGLAVNVTATVDTLTKITGLTPVSGVKSYRVEALKVTTWIKIWVARVLFTQ